MESFWTKLPKPFFCVAPMADVTDAPYRRMIAKYSEFEKRDDVVMWTEFVAADGLMRATPEGKVKLMADLKYAEEERPIVAQLFSSHPEYMAGAAKLCAELGFDGIDINMGCPDRTIEKQGCGSAMIKTPEIAKEVIRAAKTAGLPVSIKTRLGYYEDQLEDWLPALLEEDPAAVTIHARTRQEMSKVPARWERVARAVEIRNAMKSDSLILGNGDVLGMEDARAKASASGADGIMVGRALFGNPWFFHPSRRLPLRLTALPTKGVNRERLVKTDISDQNIEYVSLEERLSVMVEHTKLFVELLPFKTFSVMKKHYKAYVNGFAGAVELRAELMSATNPAEVEMIVHQFLHKQ